MVYGRNPFEVSNAVAAALKTSSLLEDPFEAAQTSTAATLMKMFKEQETIANRMALLSYGRDQSLDVLKVARSLQDTVSSVFDAHLAAEQDRMRASHLADEALRFATSVAAHERALEAAVQEVAGQSIKNKMLNRIDPAEYAWQLLQRQGETRSITEYLSTAQRDRASLVSDLVESYLSSAEYRADDIEPIEDAAATTDAGTGGAYSVALEQATTQSKAVEVLVNRVVASPLGFRDRQADQHRIAQLTLLLTLVFGLMDNLRWYLDYMETQREAAESAKETAAVVAQQTQASQAVDSLNRTLQVLLEQAIDKKMCVVKERPATIRSLPGEGLTLGTAYPNQEVLVTGKSSRWAKIRYRDHVEDREVEGWVLKHYLYPVGNSDCD